MLLKTQSFEKKGKLSSEEKLLACLFFVEHVKCPETNYKGPQGNLTIFVQKIGSFLGT